MNGSTRLSVARRAALALSALAFIASVISTSGIASADDGRPPARTTPSPMNLYQPDIKVTSLGIIKHNHMWSNDGYLFLVENVGQGPATNLKMTKDTVIKNESTHLFLREEHFKYAHQTPLNPGQKFMVEVSCTAHGPEYCDLGYVGVIVDQVVKDSNTNNNSLTNYDNISGLKQL
jgi:hypothetical protein